MNILKLSEGLQAAGEGEGTRDEVSISELLQLLPSPPGGSVSSRHKIRVKAKTKPIYIILSFEHRLVWKNRLKSFYCVD